MDGKAERRKEGRQASEKEEEANKNLAREIHFVKGAPFENTGREERLFRYRKGVS